MTKYVLDFRKVDNIKDAHKIIKESLNFPDYYGENLDALNDSLSELDKNIFIYIIVNEKTFDGLDDIIKVFSDNNINYEKIIEIIS